MGPGKFGNDMKCTVQPVVGGQEKRKKRLEKETSIWMWHYNA